MNVTVSDGGIITSFSRYDSSTESENKINITFNKSKILPFEKAVLLAALYDETVKLLDIVPAEVAKEEGFPAIAATFNNIAKVEAEHERRYLKLLSRLTDGDFFHRDGKIWWQCRNCGYIVELQDAPKTCPACLFPQAFFEPMKENY